MAGILLLCGMTIFLCVLLGIGLSIGIGEDASGDYALVQEWELPAGELRSLKADLSFSSVFLREGTDDTILIREYANFKLSQGQCSNVSQKGTELQIKGIKKNFWVFSFFNFRDVYMEIYLPADLYDELEAIDVGTTSGDITANIPLSLLGGISMSTTSGDIILDQVESDAAISTTSGDILLEGLAGYGSLSTTSGDISIKKLTGSCDMSTTSGDILLGQAGGDMELTTTSGDITIKKGQGSFLANTTSGDILLDLWEGDFSASTTSGDVDLKLPRDGSFTIDFDTVSGGCDTFFNDQLNFDNKGKQVWGKYGNGDHIIEVSTTSGDLWIGEGQFPSSEPGAVSELFPEDLGFLQNYAEFGAGIAIATK